MVITFIAPPMTISAIGFLFFTSNMLAVVCVASNDQLDFLAYAQSIVNSASIPSIAFRILLGIVILLLNFKSHDKK